MQFLYSYYSRNAPKVKKNPFLMGILYDMQKRPFLFAFDRISFETGQRESLVILSR